MNIDTPEGMEKAKTWLQRFIALFAHRSIWAIPRSGSLYVLDKDSRIAWRMSPNRDSSTERVLAEIGWKVEGAS